MPSEKFNNLDLALEQFYGRGSDSNEDQGLNIEEEEFDWHLYEYLINKNNN